MIRKYRRRPNEVKAARWSEDGDHPWVTLLKDHPSDSMQASILQGGVPDPCSSCGKPLSEHGWLSAVKCGMMVCPGLWIIEAAFSDSESLVYTSTHEEFEEEFELTPEEVKKELVKDFAEMEVLSKRIHQAMEKVKEDPTAPCSVKDILRYEVLLVKIMKGVRFE